MSHTESFSINRAWWDGVVETHVNASDYLTQAFRQGGDTLHPIESDEIGDLRGKSLVHLQCHFGLDTLSLARRGARVTGLDFAPSAVAAARRLAAEAELDARFVESNIYNAVAALGDSYDIAYVTWGAINWLPDLHHWARIVAEVLKPGGFLYLLEGHPMAMAMEQKHAEDPLAPSWRYFAHAEPSVIDEPGSYANKQAALAHTVTHEWAHPLQEIFGAILEAGLRIEMFHEHDRIAWQHWPCLEYDGNRMYRLPKDRMPLPLSFSLRARKPG
ncbi:MAG TPA: methyltransferase domain-containing protein [Candidatus Cybelea sp.]|nr:methyltransferase domain-containing protein [Candidatus Cybelea sp.]